MPLRFLNHRALMLLPGPAIGIAITGATVGVLVIGFCPAPRQHPFPTHGWLGIAALAGAEWLLFRSIAPLPIYFTPIAWSAYMLIADATVLALTGRSRLSDTPITLARMALLGETGDRPAYAVITRFNSACSANPCKSRSLVSKRKS